MGFGSYDESEQEQPDDHEGPAGEDVTAEIKGEEYEGESTTENGKDPLQHLW